ncbi:MAG: glycerol-3-phosphate dehydrogenase/oxidase [Ornithinimicrobium sp.]|uniref:glycerol-3-phosphate dehydrogenase/oxidase n=1 Tax=Ornithinimicrobium sp. TaxID=1977084 RepID=UPI0026E0A612|nr:glycerol-3-phosphate dehydrogenase/oxidase [Ornithinimicrobium sp.]MDO5739330.1 glycerol-3-phosphate dehydrogenase/oxidase [Ornithinimicrobium sp.]
MQSKALTGESRDQALTALRRSGSGGPVLDVLVIGGGVTGAGTALDAATRGLSTAVVEAQDWASGTSQWSTKLVHGGLRYLQMLDFKLVHEALTERGLLLKTLAPHLVKPMPFLIPLQHRFWQRAYYGAGVTLYDLLANFMPGRRALPIHQHATRSRLHKEFPDLKDHTAIGAVKYYDATVDDARLVTTVVRTAHAYGAYAASRTQVVRIVKDEAGRAVGAVLRDLETGEELQARARHLINCTGVWTEDVSTLAQTEGGLRVLASKGIHLVIPRERIHGSSGLFIQTEKSVLFFIPWSRYWILGTTDTPWELDRTHPVATAADIDYVLEHANAVLTTTLTRDDVIGWYAGLRPLLQPGTKKGTDSAKVSREHTVASPIPGLTVIGGGKLTTYRVMAKDAVDFALGDQAEELPSITDQIPLLGAVGEAAMRRRMPSLRATFGWSEQHTDHLLHRYGSLVDELLDLISTDASLAEPLEQAPAYLRAEIAYACHSEGVLHLEDLMMRRTRLIYEAPNKGLAAVPEIAALAAQWLGWSSDRTSREIEGYTALAQAEIAAAAQPDDAAAAAVRNEAADIAPMVPLEGLPDAPSPATAAYDR